MLDFVVEIYDLALFVFAFHDWILYLGSMLWFHVRLLLGFMTVFYSWACGFVLRMGFIVEFVS